jgi:lycopene beta-cyclase
MENSSGSEIIETDIAIIGGGSAGITLARKLSEHGTVVIEPKTPAERDACWALWATSDQQNNFQSAIKGRWNQWRLVDHEQEIIHDSHEYDYISLSSADYLRACEQTLSDNVKLVRATAENVSPEGHGGSFSAMGQRYQANYIYDSRPPRTTKEGLKQHFFGLEVRTKNPLKTPNIATLMDFRVDQSRGLHFIYALPYSDREILIESTMISKSLESEDWYRQAINQWLDQQGIEIDTIVRQESGIIAMHSSLPIDPTMSRIGAASGAVRQSSGYAFTHIQSQVSQLVEGIEKGNFEVPKPLSSQLNYMDNLFNGVLTSEPRLAVSLMMKTARSLNPEGFARFMLGQATLIDWIRVILSMPKIPFLKQVFKR